MVDREVGGRELAQRTALWPASGPPLRDRVMASWLRSEEYGVALEGVDPVFAGSYDDESLFYACGTEVLQGLHATLANEPVSLMLTDPEGLVLNRFSGDASLLRALDAVHLAPGFAFSEREVGTNGLGLALVDRVPALVHAEEHYSLSLCGYTCAAVPVIDPVTGRLQGAINLTTWSRSSSDLLLALAQSAAGNTTALMLARANGHLPRRLPRGTVYLVETSRPGPAPASLSALSSQWTDALDQATAAMASGQVVAATGEAGAGRATLMAQALRRTHRRDRILSARAPASEDVEVWLSVWTSELGKAHTSVVVCDADTLPMWAAARLRAVIDAARTDAASADLSLALTAEDVAELAAPLAALVDAVVPVPPLRERPDDVLPLAEHAARVARRRDVAFTPAARRALRDSGWPGNVQQLMSTIQTAARRTDAIDVHHLPADVLSGPGHRLTRLEALERDEILRAMTRPGATAKDAAAELGMSRATIYRKIAQYGLELPRRGRRDD